VRQHRAGGNELRIADGSDGPSWPEIPKKNSLLVLIGPPGAAELMRFTL